MFKKLYILSLLLIGLSTNVYAGNATLCGNECAADKCKDLDVARKCLASPGHCVGAGIAKSNPNAEACKVAADDANFRVVLGVSVNPRGGGGGGGGLGGGGPAERALSAVETNQLDTIDLLIKDANAAMAVANQKFGEIKRPLGSDADYVMAVTKLGEIDPALLEIKAKIQVGNQEFQALNATITSAAIDAAGSARITKSKADFAKLVNDHDAPGGVSDKYISTQREMAAYKAANPGVPGNPAELAKLQAKNAKQKAALQALEKQITALRAQLASGGGASGPVEPVVEAAMKTFQDNFDTASPVDRKKEFFEALKMVNDYNDGVTALKLYDFIMDKAGKASPQSSEQKAIFEMVSDFQLSADTASTKALTARNLAIQKQESLQRHAEDKIEFDKVMANFDAELQGFDLTSDLIYPNHKKVPILLWLLKCDGSKLVAKFTLKDFTNLGDKIFVEVMNDSQRKALRYYLEEEAKSPADQKKVAPLLTALNTAIEDKTGVAELSYDNMQAMNIGFGVLNNIRTLANVARGRDVDSTDPALLQAEVDKSRAAALAGVKGAAGAGGGSAGMPKPQPAQRVASATFADKTASDANPVSLSNPDDLKVKRALTQIIEDINIDRDAAGVRAIPKAGKQFNMLFTYIRTNSLYSDLLKDIKNASIKGDINSLFTAEPLVAGGGAGAGGARSTPTSDFFDPSVSTATPSDLVTANKYGFADRKVKAMITKLNNDPKRAGAQIPKSGDSYKRLLNYLNQQHLAGAIPSMGDDEAEPLIDQAFMK